MNHKNSSIFEGEGLDWTLTGKIWHHWELYHEGKLLASLHSKRFFSLLFEGSYDGNEIVIKKGLNGRATIFEKHKGDLLGTIESVDFLPTKFIISNDREYSICSPIFRTIQLNADPNIEKRCLCVTVFDNSVSFHIGATFRAGKIQPEDPSPWLLAVICLYMAIANSYSNP